jgi:hypothetical protein
MTLRRHRGGRLFLNQFEIRFPLYSLVIVLEGGRICQESSRLLTEVINVRLASLNDNTRRRMTISRPVKELISSIQPLICAVVDNVMYQESSRFHQKVRTLISTSSEIFR